jgi:hypothetical protein
MWYKRRDRFLKRISLESYSDWIVWRTWNKADCGEIHLPEPGRQLLTLHYKSGNNLDYFDFLPAGK